MQKVHNDTNSNGDDTSILQYEGGIQPIETSNDMVLSDSTKQRLIHTSRLCEYNSNIAKSVGQDDKANVWMLLSETAENVVNNKNDAFDAWHGLEDGAIGRDVIKNILKFYEAQGDVQILATIICVFGRDLETFLLKDDLKYDSYLIHYGYLLQTWSKFYIRVELLKHLSPTYRESGWEDISINRIYPPIQVCPTPAAPETHYEEFQGNQDIYLNGGNNFRCSICNKTVRRLLMVCKSCGHGGHGKNHTSFN